MVYRCHHVPREMQEVEDDLPGPVIGINFNQSARLFKFA